MTSPKEIIDFHTHIGSTRAGTYEDHGERSMLQFGKTTEAIEQSMEICGITQSVTFAFPMLQSKQKEANDEVFALVKNKPQFIPFAFLDPRLAESPDLLRQYVARGAQGLKLHPICHGYVVSNSMCYPMIEAAQSLHIPVLIHTGWGEYGEVRFIQKLAKDFPNLSIVIGHLLEYQDIFTIVPPLKNVSVETSYSTHPRRIAQAVDILGADRVIFGSDIPCSTPGFELYKVTHAPISDADKAKILHENAARLLNI